ncbi:MAG: hypothetical protein KGJ41_05450 [Rhodospirillales bacterium]|nr:hypothetical protein [Rhodospirillales bacterium]MDE2576730.1 hypothetical protein [Rhodospirillales bacterium]
MRPSPLATWRPTPHAATRFDAEEVLPPHVAVPLILACSLGLWVVIIKLGAWTASLLLG